MAFFYPAKELKLRRSANLALSAGSVQRKVQCGEAVTCYLQFDYAIASASKRPPPVVLD